MPRRRRVLPLVAAGCLSLGGGLLAALVRDTGGAPGTVEPRTLLPAVYAACGTNEDCVKTGISATVNAAPGASVDAVLAMFERTGAPRPGCHWAMHLLGQTLKSRTRAGDELDLEGRWHVCGYAVLHGAFEDVPLEGGVLAVGRAAFDVCLNGVLEGPLVGQCFHAIGHTVEMNLPGVLGEPYLLHAEAACIEGAWRNRLRMDAAAALKACVSGAHMRHRDTVVKPSGRSTVARGEDPATLLPQCANSLVAYACITLYMEDAFAAREDASAADLLAWCSVKSPDATEVCGYFFGLAAQGVPGRGTDMAIEACTREKTLTTGTRLACLRGVLERSEGGALLDAPGSSYCRAVEALSAPCEAIRDFRPTYPQLTSVEDALRAAARDVSDLERTS